MEDIKFQLQLDWLHWTEEQDGEIEMTWNTQSVTFRGQIGLEEWKHKNIILNLYFSYWETPRSSFITS